MYIHGFRTQLQYFVGDKVWGMVLVVYLCVCGCAIDHLVYEH